MNNLKRLNALCPMTEPGRKKQRFRLDDGKNYYIDQQMDVKDVFWVDTEVEPHTWYVKRIYTYITRYWSDEHDMTQTSLTEYRLFPVPKLVEDVNR